MLYNVHYIVCSYEQVNVCVLRAQHCGTVLDQVSIVLAYSHGVEAHRTQTFTAHNHATCQRSADRRQSAECDCRSVRGVRVSAGSAGSAGA